MQLTRRAICETIVALGAAALAGCGPRGRGDDPAALTGERRCLLARTQAETAEVTAVRCAEWFVARNGYTDLAVVDTTLVAGESIEFAATARDRLARRHNSLGRRAVVVCRGAKRGPGFTVGFLAPDRADTSVGRAVTMDTAFRALRVEHVGYLVARARADTAECRALGP